MKDNKQLNLNDIWVSFKNGYSRSVAAQESIADLNLNPFNLEVGYNSGQIHHKKSEHYKDELLRLKVATKVNTPSKTGRSLRLFGSHKLIFRAQDENGETINLLSLDTKSKKESSMYEDNRGVFPMLIKPRHRRIYLINNLLDAVTIISIGKLREDECVIYLPNGEVSNYLKVYFSKYLKPTHEITTITEDLL